MAGIEINLTTILLIAGQTILAFIGGGLFTAYLTERWSKKREYHSMMMDHTASLVRTYHLYVRLLRQSPEKRNEDALDNAHASFLSEIRILSFNPKLGPQTDALWKISQNFANLRTGDQTQEKVRAKLSTIYGAFNEILNQIVIEFRNR
uniref:hypothetical protein n=1 Tax=Yoonia sp. TaxID=2212373 RepID=UPI004047BF6D